MSSPLDYLNELNFNTKRFQKFSQIVEQFPATDTPDVKVCVCRCWQSKKFPYCDGTHKILMENGDNVGPYVAILKSPKTAKNNVIRIKQLNPNTNKNFVQTPAKSSKVIVLGTLALAPVIYFIHNKLDNRLNDIKSTLNKSVFKDKQAKLTFQSQKPKKATLKND